jgi:glycosyltransferase involved in cell wall biosynthesis
MKIAIVHVMIPFVYGGAEFLADSLKKKLIEYGHEAKIICFPFSWLPIDNIIDSMMAARLTRLDNADMMISLKFPAYLIPHENKKLWLTHQLRQAYDLAGTEYDFFTQNDYDQRIKRSIIHADNSCLKQLEGNIFTISQTVSDRLKKYNHIDSVALFPPVINEESFYSGEYGDYIFYPSRVSMPKRQNLLVDAMRYTKSGVKLVLTGKGDNPHAEDKIFRLIKKYNMSGKVTYINRFITEKERNDLYANCLGVAFIPVDEDYGYITIEAFKSAKPVITCVDSGCPAFFVQHEQCGYTVDPTAQKLAAAMDKMYSNRKNTIQMGQNAVLRLNELDITWEAVIGRLVQ